MEPTNLPTSQELSDFIDDEINPQLDRKITSISKKYVPDTKGFEYVLSLDKKPNTLCNSFCYMIGPDSELALLDGRAVGAQLNKKEVYRMLNNEFQKQIIQYINPRSHLLNGLRQP